MAGRPNGRRWPDSHLDIAAGETPTVLATSDKDRPLAARIRRASPLRARRLASMSSSACLAVTTSSTDLIPFRVDDLEPRDQVKQAPMPSQMTFDGLGQVALGPRRLRNGMELTVLCHMRTMGS